MCSENIFIEYIYLERRWRLFAVLADSSAAKSIIGDICLAISLQIHTGNSIFDEVAEVSSKS